MPVEQSWLVTDRIILQDFYGVITMEEINQAVVDHQVMVRSGIPLVHTIIDTTHLESHPGIIELRQGTLLKREDNEGWRLIIGAEGITRFAASVMMQVIGQRFRLVDTLEDALTFIQAQDESINLTKAGN